MSDHTAPNDPQDVAEALDSDKSGGPDDLGLEPDYPPDRPRGVDQYGTSAAEEQIPEPLDQRVLRERPEPLAREMERSRSDDLATDLDAVDLELDDETRDVVARIEPIDLRPDPTESDPGGAEVGRLVEPHDEAVSWTDTEGTSIARSADQSDLSAEESAVHTTDRAGRDPDRG